MKERIKKYVFNKETLTYDEVAELSDRGRSIRTVLVYAFSSISLFILSLYLLTDVFGLQTPKSLIIETRLSEERSKLDFLNRRLDAVSYELEEMARRDNMLYRQVFGMEQIPDDIREAGYGGVDRYADVRDRDYSGMLTSSIIRSDVLLKKAYLQSKSYDDVSVLSANAAQMALCVPSIPPVNHENVLLASGFGMRSDPFRKSSRVKHKGVDLSPKTRKDGEPIYATGDGVVEEVAFQRRGYGYFVLINHGFGYKTRYAHLTDDIMVVEGQTVKKGQQIATMGNTGRSTGSHLHYEVIFMGDHQNPVNYYNRDILPEDYASIIDSSKETPMS